MRYRVPGGRPMLVNAMYSVLDLMLDSSPVSVGVLSVGVALALFYFGR